jgi:probable rRNA maturation factor
MEINVLVDDSYKEHVDSGWLKKLTEKILSSQKITGRTEVGVAIVSQERIKELNSKYLGENEPTDVLSFPMHPDEAPAFISPPDGVEHLGEVIISYPQAVKQAEEHDHPVRRELAVLLVHGMLHLLGYDHGEAEEEQQMKEKENNILSYIKGETG